MLRLIFDQNKYYCLDIYTSSHYIISEFTYNQIFFDLRKYVTKGTKSKKEGTQLNAKLHVANIRYVI